MPARTYRVKITRDGQEFEAEGDKAFVTQMLRRFGIGEGPSSGPSLQGKRSAKQHSTPAKSALESKSLSIREFMQTIVSQKHTDITLAFGYYLEKNRGLESFTSRDLNNCYYEAKMEASNTSQMIIQNIKRGFMMEAKKGEKGKRFTLTNSGVHHVESKLTHSE